MKTTKILLIILTLLTFGAHAQSIYVRAGLGASICTAPHMQYQLTYITNNGTENTEEAKRGGLGSGLPFVAAAGYYFGEHFGVELGVDYFLGFPNKIVDNTQGSISTRKLSGDMLSLVPAFVMKFDAGKVKPYARLGIIIGVLNSAKTVNVMSGTSSGAKLLPYFGSGDFTAKDYGGIAIGAQAAVGAELPLNNLLSLFGEVNLNGISWSPAKGKYTKYSENGVDVLGNMTTRDKSWVYVKKLDLTETIPDSDPEKYKKINYSFANVGLIVGVKINFGK